MDPVTLAASAVAFITPYLVGLGTNAAKSATDEAGKSVWGWIKGKLGNLAGGKAVGDAEHDPKEPANTQALEVALRKVLEADRDAAKELAQMLQVSGATLSSQTANPVGDLNKIGQASGVSSVKIS